MSKISKRLLSWLCVIAMVLSFVPVVNLPAKAVEDEATATTVTPGAANFSEVSAAVLEQMEFGNGIDNSDEAFAQHLANNTCPVCGQLTDANKWTELTSTKKNIADTNGMSYHFYYADSVKSGGGNMLGFYNNSGKTSTNNKACLWLKSTTDIVNTDTRVIMLGGTDNEINIFGEGRITTNVGTKYDYGMFQMGDGVLNLYGGTFVLEDEAGGTTSAGASTDYHYAALRVAGTAVVNMYDGVTIGPEEQDTTKVTLNVSMQSASCVFNMFGGTIRNGVTNKNGYAANLNIYQGTFNMYGGTIENGAYLTNAEGTSLQATVGNNILVGGFKENTTTGYKECYFNMYGGTITGGRSSNGGHGGGNISQLGTAAHIRLMGGTISNGWAKYGGGNLYIQNGQGTTIEGSVLITNGTTDGVGGNIAINGGMKLTMKGGFVTGGAAGAATGSGNATDGGAIYLRETSTTTDGVTTWKGATFVMEGGEIDGCKANTGNGGNIYVTEHSTLTLTGGTIKNGKAVKSGGNIYKVGALTIDPTDLTVADGEAANGGNVYSTGDLTIKNGTFNGGKASERGGNVSSSQNITIDGGVLDGGQAILGGGNINVAGGKKVTVNGGTICNGWVTPTRTSSGGYSGAAWGGNIRAWTATVEINGGLIYGGVRGDNKENALSSNNIGCQASVEPTGTANVAGATLIITGGTIVGDIAASGPTKNTAGTATCPGTDVQLSGNPVIVTSYQLPDGSTVKAKSGGLALANGSNGYVRMSKVALTDGASVKVTANLGNVISADGVDATGMEKYFTMTNSAHIVTLTEEKTLKVIEKPAELDPKPVASKPGDDNWSDAAWQINAQARLLQTEMTHAKLSAHVAANTCPICEGTVEWVEATKPGELREDNKTYHYYINNDTSISSTYNWLTLYNANQKVCLALLNNTTAKSIAGLIATRSGSTNCVINIMGEGTLIGTGPSDHLGLLRVQGTGGVMNLYGGTYTRTYEENAAGQTAPKGACLVLDAGTVNIYEGVTIGRAAQADTAHFNVFVKKGTLNMYGGTIQNGRSNFANNSSLTKNFSGNVTLFDATSVFNMYSGTIQNGAVVSGNLAGGNIATQVAGSKVNIYGGTITGGSAYQGGNIYMYGGGSAAKLTIMGGTISGGVSTDNGGNIYSSAVTEIGQYARITGGSAKNGGNLSVSSQKITISGGEISDGHAKTAGGNINSSTTIEATGGTVKNGSCDDSATGGGNIYVTSLGTLTISGGLWEGGQSRNGGNIYIYYGKLVVEGDAEISGGHAVVSGTLGGMGGAIYKYNGTDNHNSIPSDSTVNAVIIRGNAKVHGGQADTTGGNIHVGGYMLLADNAEIYDGQAAKSGNLHVTNTSKFLRYYTKGGDKNLEAITPDEWSKLTSTERSAYSTATEVVKGTFEMTGGKIYDGHATTATDNNVKVIQVNFVMTGGQIIGTEGVNANGSVLRISTQAKLYLGGTAEILRADGGLTQCLQIEGDESGQLLVGNDWTGKATVGFNTTYAPGDTVKTTITPTTGDPYDYFNGLTGTWERTVDEDGIVTFTFTEGGSYTGSLLQERVGNYGILGVDGKLVIAAAAVVAADGTKTWLAGNNEALAAYEIANGGYLILNGEAEIAEDVVVELNGKNLTLSGSGKVYGIDASNDDYEGYAKLTVEGDVEVQKEAFNGDKRYIALEEGTGVWGFHRVEMILTHVTLRTTEAGLYYKANYKCDDTLAGRVMGYGVILSKDNMPGDDFMTETADVNEYTMLDRTSFVPENHTVATTSGSVFGILKPLATDGRTSKENLAYAQMDVFANLYLAIDQNGDEDMNDALYFLGDVENQNTTSGISYSLLDVVQLIDKNWDNYSETQQALINKTVSQWATWFEATEQAELLPLFENITITM